MDSPSSVDGARESADKNGTTTPEANTDNTGSVRPNNNPEPISRASSTAVPSTPRSPAVHEDATLTPSLTALSNKRKRLPHDVIGNLEDRITESPLDASAYFALIDEFKSKGKFDECRSTFNKLLQVFPTSAHQWESYIDFELSRNEFAKVANIFSRSLRSVLSVSLWRVYLNYVRRRQNVATGGPQAIQTITQSYEFVLAHVGIDYDSGDIWKDYIAFLKSNASSASWEEQQKQDQIRRTYQRAICIPISNLESIWREYDQFENQVNKANARKIMAEKSPAYMTARASLKELSSLLEGLRNGGIPEKPVWNSRTVHYYQRWKSWIEWEKGDPLELEDKNALQNRIRYAYRQAMMTLRFFPEIWFEAFECWMKDNKKDEAQEILVNGFKANQSSFLLASKLAEQEEEKRRGPEVRTIYEKLIASLNNDIALMNMSYEQKKAHALQPDEKQSSEDQSARITQKANMARNLEMARHQEEAAGIEKVSIIWGCFMNAVRRIEGAKAARSTFAKSRQAKYQSYHVYVASALMEYHCSKESNIAIRIFELGLRSYSSVGKYALAYLNFLISINDETNARALYEKAATRLSLDDFKPLSERWLSYQAWYGDFSTASKVNDRLLELYPEESRLRLHGNKYTLLGTNPFAINEICPSGTTSNLTSNKQTLQNDDAMTDPFESNAPSIPPIPDTLISLLETLPPSDSITGLTFNVPKLVELVRYANIPLPASFEEQQTTKRLKLS